MSTENDFDKAASEFGTATLSHFSPSVETVERHEKYAQLERMFARGELEVLQDSELMDDDLTDPAIAREFHGADAVPKRQNHINQQLAHERMERWKQQAEAAVADGLPQLIAERHQQPSQPRQTHNDHPSGEEAAEAAWALYRQRYGEPENPAEIERIAEQMINSGEVKPGIGLSALVDAVASRVSRRRPAQTADDDDDGRTALAPSGGGGRGAPKPKQAEQGPGDMLRELGEIQKSEGWF